MKTTGVAFTILVVAFIASTSAFEGSYKRPPTGQQQPQHHHNPCAQYEHVAAEMRAAKKDKRGFPVMTGEGTGIGEDENDYFYDNPSDNKNPTEWLFNGRDLHGTTSQPKAQQLNKRNAANLHLVWSAIHGASVEGATVVKNGRVFPASFNDTVHSLDLHTGSQFWETSIGGGAIEGAPAVTDKVYVGGNLENIAGNEFFGQVAALEKGNGAIDWKVLVDPAHPFALTSQISPIVVEDLVITGTGSSQETSAFQLPNGTYLFNFTGGVYAFNKNTGELVWRFLTTSANATDGAGGSIGYSLAADVKRGLVFAGVGNSYNEPDSPLSCSVIALDYRTKNPNGRLVWSTKLNDNCVWSIGFPNASSVGASGFPRDLDVGTYPQLFSIKWGKHVYDVVGVTDKGRNYTVMTRDAGCILWNVSLIPEGENPSLGGTPGSAYQDGVIYTIGLYDPQNLVTPEISIQAAVDFNLTAVKIILEGYTHELRSTLTALRAQNGDMLWQRTFPGVAFGSPSTNGKIVAIGLFNGELHVLDARTGQDLLFPPFKTPVDPTLTFLAGFPVLEPINAVPVIVDGDNVQLLVGSGFNFAAGAVYALGV